MNLCTKCGQETKNKKFCLKSCSVAYNNSISPKRKPEHRCNKCNEPITCNKRQCKNCSLRGRDFTLAEAIYRNHHKSSAFALVRNRARAYAQAAGWDSCVECGYDKHIEIAHRKAIKDYPEHVMVSEINKPENLIPYCRNHHWEYENGLIEAPSYETYT